MYNISAHNNHLHYYCIPPRPMRFLWELPFWICSILCLERVGDSSKCEIKSTTNIYNKHLNIEIKNTTNHTNIQQLFVRCSGYINGVFIVFNWCRRWIFIAILLFWTGLMYVKEVYSSMYNVSAPKMMYRLMHRSRSYHGWCMRVYERECRRRRRRTCQPKC